MSQRRSSTVKRPWESPAAASRTSPIQVSAPMDQRPGPATSARPMTTRPIPKTAPEVTRCPSKMDAGHVGEHERRAAENGKHASAHPAYTAQVVNSAVEQQGAEQQARNEEAERHQIGRTHSCEGRLAARNEH